MIRLTADNLSKLNDRFAGFKHPPEMYIKEYEQLTTKLDEFQSQEQKLMEQMSEENPSDHEQDNHYDSHNSVINYSPLDHAQDEFMFDELSKRQMNDHSNLNDLNSNMLNNSSNTPPTPKSPFKSVVRAYLPNNQRTTVQVSSSLHSVSAPFSISDFRFCCLPYRQASLIFFPPSKPIRPGQKRRIRQRITLKSLETKKACRGNVRGVHGERPVQAGHELGRRHFAVRGNGDRGRHQRTISDQLFHLAQFRK